MTNYKHTPGPWDLPSIGYVHKGGVIHPTAPDETLLDGESWLDMRRRIKPLLEAREAEARANAHLIAAAPELLEALEKIEELSKRGVRCGSIARAAIAKARL